MMLSSYIRYSQSLCFTSSALSNMNIIFKRLMEPLHEVCPLELSATDFVRDFLRCVSSQPIQEISLFMVSVVLSGGT